MIITRICIYLSYSFVNHTWCPDWGRDAMESIVSTPNILNPFPDTCNMLQISDCGREWTVFRFTTIVVYLIPCIPLDWEAMSVAYAIHCKCLFLTFNQYMMASTYMYNLVLHHVSQVYHTANVTKHTVSRFVSHFLQGICVKVRYTCRWRITT